MKKLFIFFVFLLVFLIFPSAQAFTITDNCVHYYNFEQETGNLTDQINNKDSINVIVTNRTATGKNGYAWDFEENTDGVQMPINWFDLNIGSIVAWIKRENTTGTGAERDTVWRTYKGAPGEENSGLYWTEATSTLYGRVDDASNSYVGGNHKNWEMVVMTWNNTVANVYLNTTNVISITTSNQPSTTGNGNYIGAWTPGAPTTYGFDGLIDEFMIFNKSLTPSDISELYNGGVGLFLVPPEMSASYNSPPTPANGYINNTLGQNYSITCDDGQATIWAGNTTSTTELVATSAGLTTHWITNSTIFFKPDKQYYVKGGCSPTGAEGVNTSIRTFNYVGTYIDKGSISLISDGQQYCGLQINNSNLACGPTNDTSPKFNFTTFIPASCKIGISAESYSVSGETDCETTNGYNHTCELQTYLGLDKTTHNIYFSCTNYPTKNVEINVFSTHNTSNVTVLLDLVLGGGEGNLYANPQGYCTQYLQVQNYTGLTVGENLTVECRNPSNATTFTNVVINADSDYTPDTKTIKINPNSTNRTSFYTTRNRGTTDGDIYTIDGAIITGDIIMTTNTIQTFIPIDPPHAISKQEVSVVDCSTNPIIDTQIVKNNLTLFGIGRLTIFGGLAIRDYLWSDMCQIDLY